jgi:hypothetical protein
MPAGRRIRFGVCSALIAGCCWVLPASADVFLLKTGARIRGDWLNVDEAPVRRYVVRWETGGQITLDSSQVAEHIREPAVVSEYEKSAPLVADTVPEQWRIAEWCRARGLHEQRKQHLWRIIELDPGHAASRQALGFSEINGKWVTRKEYFEGRGYVYYQGKWRLPQEVDLLEEKRDIERQERDWFARLKAWRGQIGTEHEGSATANLAAIKDPLAVKALAEYLRREKSQRVRLLYIAAIANIRSARSIELLTSTALNDADPEIFHSCVDRLVASQIPGLSKVLSEVLKDSNNTRLNRAAHILGRLQDRKAIPALAAALVTNHQIALPTSPRTTATFAQPTNPTSSGSTLSETVGNALGGDAVFSAGRQKAAVVQVANQEVLAALVKLSGGQSFGFDQRAWMNWWASASRSVEIR